MSEVKEEKSRKSDHDFSRGAVLDNLEAVVVAVVLALVLRCFVVEAFAIPTGSMAGTLYGQHYVATCPECGYRFAVGVNSHPSRKEVLCPNCGKRIEGKDLSGLYGGDRILVNKVLYRLEKESRWDPFVFINPAFDPREKGPAKTTFIKRLIGLPGETLEIIRGDIIIDGQVQQKPGAVQRSLWMPVYDSRYPRAGMWLFDAEGKWSVANGGLSVDAQGVEQTRYADYAGIRRDRLIRDDYGYNGGSDLNVVTDVRVRVELKVAAGNGALKLVLPEDGEELTCTLVTEGSSEKSRVSLGESVLGEVEVSLAAGRRVRVEFSRSDYVVTLKVDGREAFRKSLWSAEVYEQLRQAGYLGRLRGHYESGVRIGASGLKTALTRIRIDRDIYYGSGFCPGIGNRLVSQIENAWRGFPLGSPFGPGPVIRPDYIGPIRLGDDEYIAFGDNSPESSDSRYWGPVPRENIVGKALMVWWYPTRVRLIH